MSKILTSGSIALTKVLDGKNPVLVTLSSYSVILPSNTEGVVISNDATSVLITAKTGDFLLTPVVNSTVNDNEFRLKNITLNGVELDNNSCVIDGFGLRTGKVTNLDSDTGSITFEIEYNANGETLSTNLVLNVTKAKQGLAGENGASSFTSIRYSNEYDSSPQWSPSSATILPNLNTQSIGIYNGPIDYDVPGNNWEEHLSEYTWSFFGTQSILSSNDYFTATQQKVKPSEDADWMSNIPDYYNAEYRYLWKKTITKYQNPEKISTNIDLISVYGEQGKSIIKIERKYLVNDSNTPPENNWDNHSWQVNQPQLTSVNKNLWKITKYTYSDDSSETFVELAASKGDNGSDGKIYYQDTPPQNPFDGQQWYNTGNSGGYIQNTLYVYNQGRWSILEFSAESIKTSVLNALQANFDNAQVVKKLIIGQSGKQRIELENDNGIASINIYKKDGTTKSLYIDSDGNLNIVGNLHLSSGESVEDKIDNEVSPVKQKTAELELANNEFKVQISNIDKKLATPNLIENADPMFQLQDYPYSQTSVEENGWQKLDQRVNNKEIVPKNITTFSPKSGTKYTQQIEVEIEDGTLNSLVFSFYQNNNHYTTSATIEGQGDGRYIAYATRTINSTNPVRICDIKSVNFNGSSIKFRHPKIQEGDYTPYDMTGEYIENQFTSIKASNDSLQLGIATVGDNINDINGNISDINSDIDGINGNIHDMNSNIGNIDQNVDNLTGDFNNLDDKFNKSINYQEKNSSSGSMQVNDYAGINIFMDKTKPSGKQGTVFIGAKNKFLIGANTEVQDGFKFKANNISTGKISAETPKWIDNINWSYSVSDEDKAVYTSSFDLDSGKLNIGSGTFDSDSAKPDYAYSIQMLNGKIGFLGNYFKDQYYSYAPYEMSSIQSKIVPPAPKPAKTYVRSDMSTTTLNLNNTIITPRVDDNIGDINPPAWTENPNYNEDSKDDNKISTGLQNEFIFKQSDEENNTRTVIMTSDYAYNTFVDPNNNRTSLVIGRDGLWPDATSIAARTIYCDRVQSINDGQHFGIAMYDKTYFQEPIYANELAANKLPESDYRHGYKNDGDIKFYDPLKGDRLKVNWISTAGDKYVKFDSNVGIRSSLHCDGGMKTNYIDTLGNHSFVKFENSSVAIGTDKTSKELHVYGTVKTNYMETLGDKYVKFENSGISIGTDKTPRELHVRGTIKAQIITSFGDGDNIGIAVNDVLKCEEDVYGRKFITNSSKNDKTYIETANLSQAVKDILSISPKEYLYKKEAEQIEEWINEGKGPERENSNHFYDNNKRIGFLAEDFLSYESLKPFVAINESVDGEQKATGIDYGALTPLLLTLCQKQQEEIDDLKITVAKLNFLVEKQNK